MFYLRDISNIMAYIYNNTVVLVVYHGGGRLCKYCDVLVAAPCISSTHLIVYHLMYIHKTFSHSNTKTAATCFDPRIILRDLYFPC